MPYTYILKLNSDKFSYYIGSCNNLEERLERHNQGRAKFTKQYRPVKLIYYEEFKTKSEAIKREKYLKSFKSKKVIEKLVKRSSNDGLIV